MSVVLAKCLQILEMGHLKSKKILVLCQMLGCGVIKIISYAQHFLNLEEKTKK